MSCCNCLKLFVPALIGSAFAGQCGTVDPGQQTVAEGTTVEFRLTGVSHTVWIEWHYRNNTLNSSILLCDSKTKHCVKSYKYSLSENGYLLSIKTVTHSDSGDYFCYCYSNKGYREWSLRGALNVKRDTRGSNEQQIHLKTISIANTKEYRFTTQSATTTVESQPVKPEITTTSYASNEQQSHLTSSSTESTNEYRSLTQSATATVESETVESEVNESAKDYKVPSTLEDTSQITTIVVAGIVAIGIMLTVIVVVIICKKQKKEDIHQASQKSGPTQTMEGRDGQDNSLLNDFVRPHSRQPSERETSAVQNEAEYNSGAPCDQHASGSSAKQIDTEYATVLPKKNRISSTQQRETDEVKKEAGTPKYAAVVKNRQSDCSEEHTTHGGKDKNDHGLVYAELDLVSRPRREVPSKEYEATEYVSVDFQKTATLSQQKQ